MTAYPLIGSFPAVDRSVANLKFDSLPEPQITNYVHAYFSRGQSCFLAPVYHFSHLPTCIFNGVGVLGSSGWINRYGKE
ncbi:MAG: hypothetical protein IH840_09245 [Candidatus Heimdallarchaeota archaeon]|nr:hypothetical protein [Candidatus Heimdallarchaeota archaeon]